MRLHTKNAEPHLLLHKSTIPIKRQGERGCVFTEKHTPPEYRYHILDLCSIIIVTYIFQEYNSKSALGGRGRCGLSA